MATNAVYTKQATAKSFLSTGGTGLFTFTSVTTGAGRLSTRADFGAFPRPLWWNVYAETQLQATTPVIGKSVSMFLALWDDQTTPARPSGNVGATDAAFATKAKLHNLRHIGDIVVDAVAADTVLTFNGRVLIPTQHVSIVWWNDTGATASATATTHKMYFTPEFGDIQAAA